MNKEEIIISDKHFTYLAKKFNVSREVILRNYFDRKIINNITYDKFSQKWIKEYIKYKKEKERFEVF